MDITLLSLLEIKQQVFLVKLISLLLVLYISVVTGKLKARARECSVEVAEITGTAETNTEYCK